MEIHNTTQKLVCIKFSCMCCNAAVIHALEPGEIFAIDKYLDIVEVICCTEYAIKSSNSGQDEDVGLKL